MVQNAAYLLHPLLLQLLHYYVHYFRSRFDDGLNVIFSLRISFVVHISHAKIYYNVCIIYFERRKIYVKNLASRVNINLSAVNDLKNSFRYENCFSRETEIYDKNGSEKKLGFILLFHIKFIVYSIFIMYIILH